MQLPPTQDPRTLALAVLCQEDKPSFTLSQFPRLPAIKDPRNRALLRELLQGVTRHRTLLDFHLRALSRRPLEDLDPEVRNTLRLGIYQLMFLEKIPAHAAVNEAVALIERFGKKSAKSFVNATLRNFLRGPRREVPTEDLATRYSFPDNLLMTLREVLQWGEGTDAALEDLLAALNSPLALCVRVNSLQTKREILLNRWKGSHPNVKAKPTTHSPDGILVMGSEDLTQLPGYAEGEFIVQSEASQLVSRLLVPFDRPLEILDACAAPGGKTTHLAALQGDRGRIVALAPARGKERENRATQRLRQNLQRLRLRSVEVREETAEDFARHAEPASFDRILVDAPCTGLGTVAKHPERKWLFAEKHIQKLVAQQESILAAVRPLLKPDGILVYSVCSLSLPEWLVGMNAGKLYRRRLIVL